MGRVVLMLYWVAVKLSVSHDKGRQRQNSSSTVTAKALLSFGFISASFTLLESVSLIEILT